MSLNLKCILNWNLDGAPFFTKNLHKKQNVWKETLISSLPTAEEINDNDLVVVCIQNLFSMRTGIIGYILTMFSYGFNVSTSFISIILNYYFKSHFKSSDLEMIVGFISLLNRSIPLLNYGFWDYKNNMKTDFLKHINTNHSITSMFNMKSNILLKPIFDSGLCILSNKKPELSGFEPLDNQINNYINEGFMWSFYKNNKKGILIININISKSSDIEIKTKEMTQLQNLYEKLYNSINCDENMVLETYITGDFVVEKEIFASFFTDFEKINQYKSHYLFYRTEIFKISFNNIKIKFEGNDDLVKFSSLPSKKRFNDFEIRSLAIQTLEKYKLKKREEKHKELQEIVIHTTTPENIVKTPENISPHNIETINPLETYFKSECSSQSSNTDEEWAKI
jgi:hypothetical protein